jgi:glycosyltransferase domain-containing protein
VSAIVEPSQAPQGQVSGGPDAAAPQFPADHTIVIPTYNRPQLVARLVAYYARREPRLNLLVLDSSRPEVVDENARSLRSLGGLVRHLAFPQTLPMVGKIANGLGEVATPFVSLCGDDDIVFPDGLREATAFLGRHQDYVSAHGLYVNFRIAGHEVHLMREYSGAGNEAEHPGQRIFSLCENYESLFYAAFRTPDLQRIAAAATALPTLHFQELFQSIAALITGKVKRFPKFYGGRQSCEPAEPERDKWQTYYWFADDPAEFLNHYGAYRDEVWRFYQAHGTAPGLDRNALFRVLDLAHAVYFAGGCPPDYFMSRLQGFWPEAAKAPTVRRDLLHEIRPHNAHRELRRALRLFNFLRRRFGRRARSRWASDIAELDRSVGQSYRAPWSCKLPRGLEWLAAVPDFRRAYGELCLYLDDAVT